MNMQKPNMQQLALGATLATLAIACGPSGTVKVDTTLADSAALQTASRIDQTLAIPSAAGSLVIESVQVAVNEVELEGEDEGDSEVELGGRVVPVALDGQPTEVITESVTAGTYHEFGMELVVGGESGLGGSDPASILVKGSFEGQPFSYSSKVAPELEVTLPEPLTVRDGGEARVAITFDVAAWFLGADGYGLDPREGGHRPTIEANIRASMAAHAELEDGEDDD